MTTMFELTDATSLKVAKVTPRKEIHGDENIQAISLRLSLTAANDLLDRLHPELRDMLFYDPPEVAAQLALEGVAPVKKHRRCVAVVQPLKLDREHSGYTVTIAHGIDEESALELYGCTVNKFAVEAMEGGTVEVSWNVSSNRSITPELVGLLCAKEGEWVDARMVAPVFEEGHTIDGTIEGYERDRGIGGQDAGDLFSEQHGGDGEGQEPGDQHHAGDFGQPEGDEAQSTGTDDAAAFEAGMAASMAGAGLKPKAEPRGRRPSLGVVK